MLIDAFREVAGLTVTDEDGNTDVLRLLPPATTAEIAALEASLPAPLPADVREALAFTKGLANGSIERLTLIDPDPGGFGLEDVFPHAHAIGHDGFGNYWVVDLLPSSRAWGPIFFACHDPPVVAWQCATVEEFVRAAGKRDPDALSHDAASVSTDPLLRELARVCGPEYLVVDLRAPVLGSGFSWGRWGPRTRVRRCGEHRVWAYAPPEKRPGLWSRLLGR
jgi:SMI1 / KNR4 family (SUKH-1)